MASIFLSDMGHISHCDIWEIFFLANKQTKHRGNDSQKQNMEVSAERAQIQESAKPCKLKGNDY